MLLSSDGAPGLDAPHIHQVLFLMVLLIDVFIVIVIGIET
jgi:hypothetical protein